MWNLPQQCNFKNCKNEAKWIEESSTYSDWKTYLDFWCDEHNSEIKRFDQERIEKECNQREEKIKILQNEINEIKGK